MVIKNCEDKYTYLFRVTKGLKTINAKTTTFSGSRFLGSPDKPGGLSIQLCKSEKKEFYIRYSS
mgnify:CR=1 FL=1